MFLAPNGKVFLAGFPQTSRYLDVSGTGTWTTVGDRQVADRTMGSAVMYAPGKILYVGGGDPPTSSAEVIDLNQGSPSWRSVAGMAFARRQLNATILADGQVLVTHGTSGAGFNNVAGAGSRGGAVESGHRVLVHHGRRVQTPDVSFHRLIAAQRPGAGERERGGRRCRWRTAIFPLKSSRPPYLFKADGTLAARPSISSAPSRISYGAVVLGGDAGRGSVVRGTLVRLSSVTHAFNQSQLIYPLTFAATGPTTLTGAGPTDADLCAPGPVHAVPGEPGRRTVHGSDGERRPLTENRPSPLRSSQRARIWWVGLPDKGQAEASARAHPPVAQLRKGHVRVGVSRRALAAGDEPALQGRYSMRAPCKNRFRHAGDPLANRQRIWRLRVRDQRPASEIYRSVGSGLWTQADATIHS